MMEELPQSVATCAQILTAVLMFSASLPLRQGARARIAVCVAFFAAWSVLLAVLVPLSSLQGGGSAALFLIFACSLFAALFVVVFVFEASIWTGFFCATAGYAMQNLASSAGRLLSLNGLAGIAGFVGGMVVPYVVVYALCHYVLISRIRRQGLVLIEQRVMLIMMAVVLFAVIGFDVIVKDIEAAGVPQMLSVSCRLAHLLLCVGVLAYEYEVLYNRQLQLEVASVAQMMEQEKEQYRVSRETIEAINLKCHDIKHQIRRLGTGSAVDPKVLEEMEREVDVYDAAVHTGNEPLDVILTEKSLLCEREGITLSCIADGQALAFLPPTEIYSLMGNALDNAIEAARRLDDPARRSVSLVVRVRGGMATVHVENFFDGEVELGADGLPRTTKADAAAHGYGMRSMRVIAEKHQGTLHVRTQGDVFHVNIAIPLPA